MISLLYVQKILAHYSIFEKEIAFLLQKIFYGRFIPALASCPKKLYNN